MDRGNVKDKASQSWGKQMSLHDELLSHERLTANEEMRRKIQKQQSLPDNNDQVRAHHAQCARTDLNKRFLPKPMTTTG